MAPVNGFLIFLMVLFKQSIIATFVTIDKPSSFDQPEYV